jgi:hypothetical protein
MNENVRGKMKLRLRHEPYTGTGIGCGSGCASSDAIEVAPSPAITPAVFPLMESPAGRHVRRSISSCSPQHRQTLQSLVCSMSRCFHRRYQSAAFSPFWHRPFVRLDLRLSHSTVPASVPAPACSGGGYCHNKRHRMMLGRVAADRIAQESTSKRLARDAATLDQVQAETGWTRYRDTGTSLFRVEVVKTTLTTRP